MRPSRPSPSAQSAPGPCVQRYEMLEAEPPLALGQRGGASRPPASRSPPGPRCLQGSVEQSRRPWSASPSGTRRPSAAGGQPGRRRCGLMDVPRRDPSRSRRSSRRRRSVDPRGAFGSVGGPAPVGMRPAGRANPIGHRVRPPSSVMAAGRPGGRAISQRDPMATEAG